MDSSEDCPGWFDYESRSESVEDDYGWYDLNLVEGMPVNTKEVGNGGEGNEDLRSMCT